jgi:Flp pilus assembly pilin Flp
MLKAIKRFATAEDGAITVDWVVLTAAILGIQIVILVGVMEESMVEVSEKIGDKVSEAGNYLND